MSASYAQTDTRIPKEIVSVYSVCSDGYRSGKRYASICHGIITHIHTKFQRSLVARLIAGVKLRVLFIINTFVASFFLNTDDAD